MNEKLQKKLDSMTHREKGELLDKFLTLMGEVAPETEEEVEEFLVDRGYDIDELNRRSKEVLAPALAASPLNPKNIAKGKNNG